MTSQAVTGAAASSSYSGFGSRQEEKLYDTINFNLLSLLGMRFAKFFREVQEGNYNPYSKAQAAEDAHLKEIIRKFLKKLVKMERKKYTAPRLSEALKDLASLLKIGSASSHKSSTNVVSNFSTTSSNISSKKPPSPSKYAAASSVKTLNCSRNASSPGLSPAASATPTQSTSTRVPKLKQTPSLTICLKNLMPMVVGFILKTLEQL